MDDNLIRIVQESIRKYNSLSNQEKEQMRIETDVSCTRYLYDIYLNQARLRLI